MEIWRLRMNIRHEGTMWEVFLSREIYVDEINEIIREQDDHISSEDSMRLAKEVSESGRGERIRSSEFLVLEQLHVREFEE